MKRSYWALKAVEVAAFVAIGVATDDWWVWLVCSCAGLVLNVCGDIEGRCGPWSKP